MKKLPFWSLLFLVLTFSSLAAGPVTFSLELDKITYNLGDTLTASLSVKPAAGTPLNYFNAPDIYIGNNNPSILDFYKATLRDEANYATMFKATGYNTINYAGKSSPLTLPPDGLKLFTITLKPSAGKAIFGLTGGTYRVVETEYPIDPQNIEIAVLQCGNALCDIAETYDNCPSDCQFTCGNDVCDETYDICPTDCPSTGCGNNVCDAPAETSANCPVDCLADCITRYLDSGACIDESDCAAQCGSPWWESSETKCTDKIDNDLDGQIDCDDSDCVTDISCFHDTDNDNIPDSEDKCPKTPAGAPVYGKTYPEAYWGCVKGDINHDDNIQLNDHTAYLTKFFAFYKQTIPSTDSQALAADLAQDNSIQLNDHTAYLTNFFKYYKYASS